MSRYLLAAAALGLAAAAWAAAPEVKRATVVVQHRPAKELADLLSSYFGDAAVIQAAPDASSNVLLVRAAAPVMDEVMAAVSKLDRAPRTIVVEALTAEVMREVKAADLDGPAAAVAARMEEMNADGTVIGLKRARLTLVEGRLSSLLDGATKPSVAAINTTAMGTAARGIMYRSVGVLVQTRAVVTPDGLVSLDLTAEDADIRTPESGVSIGLDEQKKPVFAAEYPVMSWRGKVDVPDGNEARLVRDETSESGKKRRILVVTARTVEAGAKPGE